MSAIVGIDAAWTEAQPSGVALVTSHDGDWRCAAVAPSYQTFLALAAGTPVDWNARGYRGGFPSASDLLDAARRLAGREIDLVTIDMPIATVSIAGRRTADREVSKRFGGQGCSTHTPSTTRPGPLGAVLSHQFGDLGYPIATRASKAGTPRRLVEVYPHPALLALLQCFYRVRYKVPKTRKYWPGATASQRTIHLITELAAIRKALLEVIRGGGLDLPAPDAAPSLSFLKRYEDALDALVCAWAGIRYLGGSAEAFGDETAAIWCPADGPRPSGPRRGAPPDSHP